ncbi:VOC family protein [Kitasatospora sp. NPDC056327]|uniref:VOC family protein n=1 Tax=Kitasatospora sp. NPDC056327 TaxID=3345785 RepID=UPI0035D82A6F
MPVVRTYTRVYVDDLDTALPAFVGLTGEQPSLRFAYRGLELAAVGGHLLLAGTPEALAPYRATHATVIITSLDEALALLAEHGGEILDGPNTVPTGRNVTVRHPGGAIVEYVEHHEEAIARLP